jgi:enamine deaminase RidA (YjgF/YER057c/UK114 family)
MTTQHHNPEGVSAPTGYTHVVAAEGSRIVFVSSQVPLDAQGELVGGSDLPAQGEQVFAEPPHLLASRREVDAWLAKLGGTSH